MNCMGTPDGLVSGEDFWADRLPADSSLGSGDQSRPANVSFREDIASHWGGRKAAAASNEPRIGEIGVFRLVPFAIG
jgi:hypothetical protein